MATNADYLRLKRDFNRAKYQFVMTELELALTFCDLALSASAPDKLERNSDHAAKAYEAAIRFLDSTALTEEMQREVSERVSSLEILLDKLRDNHSNPESADDRS